MQELPSNAKQEQTGAVGRCRRHPAGVGVACGAVRFHTVSARSGLSPHRAGPPGRAIALGSIGELSRTQKEGVNLLTSAVDRLLSTVNRYNHSTNGNHNGKDHPQRRKRVLKKKKSSRPARPSKPSLSVRNNPDRD